MIAIYTVPKNNKITIVQDIVIGINTINHNLDLQNPIGATTSISVHNITGGGLGDMFIKIGTIWYRF